VLGDLIEFGAVPSDEVVDLIEPGQLSDAYAALASDQRAAEFVKAALARSSDSAQILAEGLDAGLDRTLVAELAAAGFTDEAFRTVQAQWDAELEDVDKDLVLELLEQHAHGAAPRCSGGPRRRPG
jgi:hypothetical protein